MSKSFAVGERHLPPVPEGTPPEMEHLAIGDTAAIPGDTPQTTFRGTENGLATGPDDPNNTKFGSSHTGNLIQFVFLDGHVRGLRPDIALAVLKALSTISGGEITDDLD
jgi:prepilin-type processing-associated H-X9-DG protein